MLQYRRGKQERKRKWERRQKSFSIDNFLVALKSDDKVEHKSYQIIASLYSGPATYRDKRKSILTIISFSLPMWGQTGRHDPCVAGWDDSIISGQWAPCLTNPRDISSFHVISIFFQPNTLKCPSVVSVSCCFQWQWVQKHRKATRKTRGRIGEFKQSDSQWSSTDVALRFVALHRGLSRGLCPRTILTRAAE